MQEAQNKFLQGLFAASGESHSARGKLSFISVASKFKLQLQELMDKLGGTVSILCSVCWGMSFWNMWLSLFIFINVVSIVIITIIIILIDTLMIINVITNRIC